MDELQPREFAVGFKTGRLILLSTAFAIAAASFWYWVAFTLASNDTAWLMRAGQLILAERRLPSRDIFSWTCRNEPWVLYQWLFEVLLAATFNTMGPRGLWVSALLASVAAGIVYFYLLPRQWLRLRLPLTIAFPFLAFALSPPWFFVRPQLVSHLFIPLFINACERFRRTGRARSLWYLPLLMIIWANCHPLWVIGILIIGAYVLPYCVRNLKRPGLSRLLAPLAMLGVSGLAVLVNPYGAGLIGYEWYFNSASNFKAVNELRPLLIDPPVPFYPFLVFCAVSCVFIISRLRYVPPPGWIISGLGIAAALAVNKFAPVGALLVWPYLGFALASLRTSRQAIGSRVLPGPPAAATVGALLRKISTSTRRVDSYLNRKGGFRLLLLAAITSAACFETRIPTSDYAIIVFAYNDVDTMRFLATHRYPHRHIFNDEPTGSLMIFFNVLPVFCDGRVDFYGKDFCDKWLSCTNGDPGWQEYLNKFGVDELVIKDSTGLYSELSKSPEWLRGYDNGLRSIWLRNNDAGKAAIQEWQVEAKQ